MAYTKLGAEIWRDYVTDGVPATGPNPIAKIDMRTWMGEVEAFSGIEGLATVASASTTDLGASRAWAQTVTGSVTILSFGAAAPAGALRWLRFAGAPLITHNGTSLICPNGADIQLTTGSRVCARHEGSGNWRILDVVHGDGRQGFGIEPSALVHVAAGTATVPPVRMTAGTSLTTPVAGADEFDGVAFYRTPTANSRAVDLVEHGYWLDADATGSNVNTAQPLFPTLGSLTIPINVSFEFECEFVITRAAGTTSHTTTFGFGGTATIGSARYFVDVCNPSSNALTAVQRLYSTGTPPVITAANTSATEIIMASVRGIIRTTGGGTLIPQFQYSAAPGGAPTIVANSFFRVRPLGAYALARVGNWS